MEGQTNFKCGRQHNEKSGTGLKGENAILFNVTFWAYNVVGYKDLTASFTRKNITEDNVDRIP